MGTVASTRHSRQATFVGLLDQSEIFEDRKMGRATRKTCGPRATSCKHVNVHPLMIVSHCIIFQMLFDPSHPPGVPTKKSRDLWTHPWHPVTSEIPGGCFQGLPWCPRWSALLKIPKGHKPAISLKGHHDIMRSRNLGYFLNAINIHKSLAGVQITRGFFNGASKVGA